MAEPKPTEAEARRYRLARACGLSPEAACRLAAQPDAFRAAWRLRRHLLGPSGHYPFGANR